MGAAHGHSSGAVGAAESAALAAAAARTRRARKRIPSPERFEVEQLIASGVLPPEAHPEYDEEHGLMHVEERGADEEFEVELVEDVPAFLESLSHDRQAREMSPVQVVRNPDGTLQRAAMTQSAMIKERRELKYVQHQQLLESIPKDLARPWADPMAAGADRHLAAELQGVGASFNGPAWKEE